MTLKIFICRVAALAITLLLTACGPGAVPGVYTPAPELAGVRLPPATDPNFCQALQQFLAQTNRISDNTVFSSAEDYIESKTTIEPLTTYQYLTVIDDEPVAVSCKFKGAAYLRAVYGDDAAGTQYFCPAATAAIIGEVVAALGREGDTAAAERARALVIDDNPPVSMGPNYLADFALSYTDANGAVHIQSPGLFQDYDHWVARWLPDHFAGTQYCHLPTQAYIRALATGEQAPGLVVSLTGD